MSQVNTSEISTSAPMTLLFHKGDVNIVNDRSDLVEITPIDTITYARGISKELWDDLKSNENFMLMFRLVFKDIDLPDHDLQRHGSGVQHVVGLIMLTVMAINAGKNPFWRNPESHLHPSSQTGLADLAILFSNGGKQS